MAKVYWDKGHGGTDAGAVGNGLQEKNLTHKIVEYAMAYMDARYENVQQRTSRSGDETRTLAQRTNDANAWGADVLISVHINSAAGSAASGFETYIYNQLGSQRDTTISLQNFVHDEVIAAMRTFGGIQDRGKKQASFHMLRESNMPALLTENLFIVNASDANLLRQEGFLKAVGEAHARGVAKYLGVKEKVANAKIISFYTGGYSGGDLTEIHTFIISNNWWFQPFRNPDGTLSFLIGGFGEGSEAANKLETYLKEKNWWYEIR